MVGIMNMRKSTKGFYTLEASIFLPLVILAILTLGYFMRVEGTWERCVHGAVDESMLAASKSYDSVNAFAAVAAVSQRINEDLRTGHMKTGTPNSPFLYFCQCQLIKYV